MDTRTEHELRETIGAERFSAAMKALNEQLTGFGTNLIDMTDTVLCEVNEIDLAEPHPEDQCAEIADSAVPVYTHEIMAAIGESIELAASESELGPAFDGSPTPSNVAAGVLYELASNIAHARLSERMDD